MRGFLFASLLFLSACDVAQAASCDDGDIGCKVQAFSVEDMKAAIWYVGPCYRFAHELCYQIDACSGSVHRSSCVDFMIEDMCINRIVDPETMMHCADWAEQISCDYFFDPENTYERSQPCADLYSHPAGGIDSYESTPPPGA